MLVKSSKLMTKRHNAYLRFEPFQATVLIKNKNTLVTFVVITTGWLKNKHDFFSIDSKSKFSSSSSDSCLWRFVKHENTQWNFPIFSKNIELKTNFMNTHMQTNKSAPFGFFRNYLNPIARCNANSIRILNSHQRHQRKWQS